MWSLLSCWTPAPEAPAPPAGLREALTLAAPTTTDRSIGRVYAGEGYGVETLALTVGGVPTSAALFSPHEGASTHGALVATGHFEQAKSGPDAQDIAHRLVAMGLTVLIVDDFGSEEWATRGLALHSDRGAHNRAWLRAGGSSPLALQLAALSAGLDHLESRGVESVVATGASGGAVLSFWLAHLDERVQGVVLAAVPELPRSPAGGCDCKDLPGFPGPDPRVLSTLPVPSLWLSERQDPAPEGLPSTATWRHMPGPHAYTTAMQRAAVEWIGELFDLEPVWQPSVPTWPLEVRPTPAQRRLAILDLALQGAPLPSLEAQPPPYTLDCEGSGERVLTLGAQPQDREALMQAGLQPCALLTEGDAWTQAAALRAAGGLAYGVGGWSVAVAWSGLPHVLRSPPADATQVDPDSDPTWAHAPGLWWRPLPWDRALLVDEDPRALAEALRSSR